MLNDARVASAWCRDMSKSRTQQKKYATIRDFHVYICVNSTIEKEMNN